MLDTRAFRQTDMTTSAVRDMVEANMKWRGAAFAAHGGWRRASDRFEDGDVRLSDQISTGASLRTFGQRLQLLVDHERSLKGRNANADFPTRTALGADWNLTKDLAILSRYELTDGETENTRSARVGLRASPWSGGQVNSSLEQRFTNGAQRAFANLGLRQLFQVNDAWGLDFGLDHSRAKAEPDHRRFDEDVPPASGSSDDFTSGTVGIFYRADNWQWNMRYEIHHSDLEDKLSIVPSVLVEPSTGYGLAATARIHRRRAAIGTMRTDADIRLGFAARPQHSRWTVLDRLRWTTSDQRGLGVGSSNWRIVNNLTVNYRSPQHTQFALNIGAKYNREDISGRRYSAITDLIGLEVRQDLGRRWDLGYQYSALHSFESGQVTHSTGASVGFNVMKNAWVSVGYNFCGFRDAHFTAANATQKGPFVAFRFKIDQDTIASLLGRSQGVHYAEPSNRSPEPQPTRTALAGDPAGVLPPVPSQGDSLANAAEGDQRPGSSTAAQDGADQPGQEGSLNSVPQGTGAFGGIAIFGVPWAGGFPVNSGGREDGQSSPSEIAEAPRDGKQVDRAGDAHLEQDVAVELVGPERAHISQPDTAVVEEALEATGKSRFATADQLEQAAKKQRSPAGLAAIIAALLLAAAGLAALGRWLASRTGIWPPPVAAQASRPSLAVLPFENTGAPGENDHLAASLAEELTTRLAQIDQIDVLSWAAVEHYKGKWVDPQELRRIFAVDYLLLGSVLVAEDHFRLDVRFLDAETGSHVWTDILDGKLDDVFTFQDVVIDRVGSALGVAEKDVDLHLGSRRWTENAEAYRCYLVGREISANYEIPQHSRGARSWFEQALALDPDYAPAMATLALSLVGELKGSGRMEPGTVARASALTLRAQEIDPSLPLAWHAEGQVFKCAGYPVAARVAYEHALELNRNLHEVRVDLFDVYYEMLGERDLAVALAREGIDVNPYEPVHYAQLASVMIEEGRFAEADALFADARRLMPDNRRLQLYEAIRLSQEGLWSETIAAYRDLIAESPELLSAYSGLGRVLTSLGRHAEADSVLALAAERWPGLPLVAMAKARSSLALGHYEEAENQLRAILAADEYIIEAWGRLGRCLLAQGRTNEAEATILEIAARWQDYSGAYDWICSFYREVGEAAKLEGWAQKMTVRFPELADGMSWLADSYRLQGDYERAVEQYRQALEIRDGSFWDNQQLSLSLQGSGRLDEAVAVAQGWVERRPVHPEGWNLLGDLQRDAGEQEAAVAAYEKVLKFGAGTALADSARAQLVAMQEHCPV